MKRDINYALMGLLLLTLVSIVGLSAYYKYTFQDLGKRYTNARTRIEAIHAELNKTQHELDERNNLLRERERILEEKESQVDEYFSALNISKQRESSLGDMFNQIRTENALLQKQLSDTQNELDKTSKDFTALTKNFNEKAAQLNTLKNLFGQVDSGLAYINDRVTEIGYKADDIVDTVDKMEDTVSEVESNRVREDLEDQLGSIDASITDLSYALKKVETKLNDTEYFAGRIRDLK